MSISDQALESLHETASGPTKEALGELRQARKAIAIARDLAQLGPILKSAVNVMCIEGATLESLQLAVIRKNPDGSGKVGPTWALGEFAADLEKLSDLVHDDEERQDLSAAGLTAIFGGAPL